MDRLQYSKALSDVHWPLNKGVENNFILPVAVGESVAEGVVTDVLREVFLHHICKWAWCNLPNIGRRRYNVIRVSSKSMAISQSKLIGTP